MTTDRRKPAVLLAILVSIWLSLFLLRYSAPSDLLDKDQERPAAYMADAALNGNWIVQVDDHGNICSKPPVYTWIGAGLILLTGRINDFALYFPSALGVLGCCLLIWFLGVRRFGALVAFLGGSALLLSALGIRILYLARTDAMFAFATLLTAFLGYRAWQKKSPWIGFWLAATLATLTKGPLGLVLAAGGLLGLIGLPRPAGGQSNEWRSHALGVLIFLVVTLGWLGLAYLQKGEPVIAKLIGRELYGHTNWRSERFSPGIFFFTVPSLYFFSRFFPWSLPAIFAVWRVWKHPAQDPAERSLERFLAAYVCFGILLFSVVPHQRPDHLFPLLPAAGLLAGRELVRWFTARKHANRILPLTIGLWLTVLLCFGIYYFRIDPAHNPWFAKTAGVRTLARQYEARYGAGHRLIFVDVPYGLQYYLNVMQQRMSFQEAVAELEKPEAVVLAVRDIHRLQSILKPDAPIYKLIQWPEQGDGFITLVSNRKLAPLNVH